MEWVTGVVVLLMLVAAVAYYMGYRQGGWQVVADINRELREEQLRMRKEWVKDCMQRGISEEEIHRAFSQGRETRP